MRRAHPALRRGPVSETPEPAASESPEPVEASTPEPADSESAEPVEVSTPEPSSPMPAAPEPKNVVPPAAATRRGRLTLIAATLVYFTWSLVIGVLATRNDWSPLPRLIRFALGILLWVAIWKGYRWARVTMGLLAIVGLVGGSILAYASGVMVLAKAAPLAIVAWALLFDRATKDYLASRRQPRSK